ncbi:FISUMP domain-containing protein [Fibrobacter succinogenes]|uniref:FISUMP domain-containing protein n=1 Tax=Fibrobacter succinogenes TaxID=833 RepID=UPI0015651310|nr:FISUMP domain-containing protein [Fibrobacter succinogenes]
MKNFVNCEIAVLAVTAVLVLGGCGDDESFSPVSKGRDYDYVYTSAKDLSKTPCNEMRKNREAVIGRDKDRYECRFDYQDSVYIWVGYSDTLTAEGREYHRTESSSSSSRTKTNVEARLKEKGEQFNPDIDYGTMTDPRDGKAYRTVVVNGLTWMAENLNYADNEVGESLCINDEENLCELYGRLYSRDATMNSSSCEYRAMCDYLTSELIQGVCPDGWRLPTVEEAEGLVNLEDGVSRSLMSAKSWGSDTMTVKPGTDDYGLSFVAAGFFSQGSVNPEKNGFNDLGEAAFMWVAQLSGNRRQYYFLIRGWDSTAVVNNYYDHEVYNSVRCVKGAGSVPGSWSVSSSSVQSSSSMSSSSSSELFDWTLPKETYLNPEIDYDTIIDSRDGKVYKTVKIGEQTWMAENLNFDPGQGGPDGAKYDWSWCYNNEPQNCDVAGRLYTWAAAIDSVKLANDADNPLVCGMGKSGTFWTTVQGICPEGWHLPSTREWSDLKDAVGGLPGKNLKSQTGWNGDGNGTNITGFSAIPAGWRHNGIFGNNGIIAYFWGSYGSYENKAEYMELFAHPDSWEVYYLEKDYGFSVRCIKDEVLPASSSSSSSQSSSSVKSSSSFSSSSVKSSSSVNSSSSVSSSSRIKQANAEPLLENAGDQFNPDIDYGTLIDERDGKTYKTVEVGNAVWMAENLNYAGNEIGESVCFNDEDRFCEFYGRLYSRDAAMNSTDCAFLSGCNLGSAPVQGICPDGWHIPTNKEGQALANFAGKLALPLRSAKGWETEFTPGTDEYGLSFLGSGSFSSNIGFHSFGKYEHLWLYFASTSQYYLGVNGSTNEAEVWVYGSHEIYSSVRCVKD